MALFKVYDSRRFAQLYSQRSANTTDTADTIPGNAVYGFTASATLTLRDATTNAGAVITVRNNGAHATGVVVTINCFGAQAIDGQTSYELAARQAVTLASDGNNWRVIAAPARARTTVGRTTAYTVLKEDLFNGNVIVANSGTFTVTLLSAGSVRGGDQVTIKNGGAGTITVATTSSQLIDGASTQTLTPNQAITVMSTGSSWHIVSRA